MDTEEYRKKIEEEILKIIEDKLKARQMNAQRAREIAQYVLETLHPHMDINQMYTVAQSFDDHFSELVPVVLKISQEYEEKVKVLVIEHVGNLLKQNRVKEAHSLIKQAINKQIRIK